MSSSINSKYLRQGTICLLSRYYQQHKDYNSQVPSWVQVVLSYPSLFRDTLEVFQELKANDLLKKIDNKVYRYTKKFDIGGRYTPVFLANESLIDVSQEAKEFLKRLSEVVSKKESCQENRDTR